MGVDRSLYCVLENLWVTVAGRLILQLPRYLAPVKAGFLPLVSKDHLPELAYSWFDRFKKDFNVVYDESGSIGRRYRRLDEIGAPYAFTADSQSFQDGKLTVRERDEMTQRRVSLDEAALILEDSDKVPQ
jgi:glycyl-tRNA synthetase